MQKQSIYLTAVLVSVLAVSASNARAAERVKTSDEGLAVFSPDGRKLAVYRNSGIVTLWNTKSGKKVATLPIEVKPPQARRYPFDGAAIEFSPDGRTLATAGAVGTVHLWNVDDGTRRFTLLAGNQDRAFSAVVQIPDLAFAPDGQTLVTTSQSNLVQIWDIHTGKETVSIDLPRQGFNTVAAYDGATLIVLHVEGKPVASPRRLIVADPKTGMQRFAVEGQTLESLSPDGRTMVTKPDAGPSELWDAVTGERIATLD